jgi:hypothetical protein
VAKDIISRLYDAMNYVDEEVAATLKAAVDRIVHDSQQIASMAKHIAWEAKHSARLTDQIEALEQAAAPRIEVRLKKNVTAADIVDAIHEVLPPRSVA